MKRPSATLIVATLAFFVSLCGAGIAASHYLISSTKQISPSVLKKLENAGPQGPQGNPGAVGATGATGVTGAVGAAGMSAIVDITYVNAQVYQPQGTYTTLVATANCPAGYTAIGGTANAPASGSIGASSYTATEQTGVYNASMIATAVCAEGPGI